MIYSVNILGLNHCTHDNREDRNPFGEPLSTNHWEVGKPSESCRRHPKVLSVVVGVREVMTHEWPSWLPSPKIGQEHT